MPDWWLSADASPGAAEKWLRELIRRFGPGFHLDTSPDQYVFPDGQQVLDSDEAMILEGSLRHLFLILGNVVPYQIGEVEVRSLLMKASAQHASPD